MPVFSKFSMFAFLLFICLSCSSDDDASASVSFEEKLVGTWQLVDRSPNGIEYCELSNTVQFSADNSLFLELFVGDEPGNCQEATASGVWAYLGDNQLELDFAGTSENVVLEADFSDNNTVLELKNDSGGNVEIETYTKQ